MPSPTDTRPDEVAPRRAFVMSEGGGPVANMLDEPITLREILLLVTLVRDEKPRDPLRRLEDVLLDLHAKASA